MSKYEVICVDDEEKILELYEQVFEDTEFSVITFTDGEDALRHLEGNSKNVVKIFSDFNMPRMNGFEFREKVLESDPDIPFSIITAFYDKEMATKAMKLSINEFIDKPIDEEKMIEVCRNYSAQRIEQLKEEEEMVLEFLHETSPMLDEMEDLILVLEETPSDESAINTYFRLLHTIKGTSACLGLLQISEFSHKYEDLINEVKNGKRVVSKKIVDVLLQGLDFLKQMYDSKKASEDIKLDVPEIVKIFEIDTEENSSEASVDEESQNVTVAKKVEKEEKVSVNVDTLNDFLELSGELTVLRNTIFKSLFKLQKKFQRDRDLEILSESLFEMQKVSTSLQGRITDLRKISLSNIFRPMKRVVRDASKNCGKVVNFETVGDELRVDTILGKVLSSVLVHLLRNSIDHGIEDGPARKEKGKTEEGNVSLNIFETGENIVVEVKDDGNGLNKDAIKKKALEKNLYSAEELDEMSDQKIFHLIFESGFSTAAAVTNISGRGVGMDMVKNTVLDVGGKILIDSVLGEGSTFTLVLPIPRSILIIKSLMIGSMEDKYLVPLDEVREVVLYEKDTAARDIKFIEGSAFLTRREELIPLVKLSDITTGKSSSIDSEELRIVILQSEGYKYGLLVDKIMDIEEVVVKSLNQIASSTNTFLGVTFIGDGELGLIINTQGVAENIQLKQEQDMDSDFSKNSQDTSKVETLESYLRFNLFKNNNMCIHLDDVYRLEEIQSSEIQSVGNHYFYKYGNSSLPLVFLEEKLGLPTVANKDVLSEVECLNVIVVKFGNKHTGLIVNDILDIGESCDEICSSIRGNEFFIGTLFFDDHTFSVLDLPLLLEVEAETILEEAVASQAA